jgi:hypothetical protein
MQKNNHFRPNLSEYWVLLVPTSATTNQSPGYF